MKSWCGAVQFFATYERQLDSSSRIYRGDIVHQGTAYPGQHKAILDREFWQIVQDKLAANRREHSLAVGAEAPSLLAGLIVDTDGNRMTPTHATKKAKRYRFYVAAPLLADDRPQALRTKACALYASLLADEKRERNCVALEAVSGQKFKVVGKARRLLFRPSLQRTCERISGRRTDWTFRAAH